jgi:hypothetical protein
MRNMRLFIEKLYFIDNWFLNRQNFLPFTFLLFTFPDIIKSFEFGQQSKTSTHRNLRKTGYQ